MQLTLSNPAMFLFSVESGMTHGSHAWCVRDSPEKNSAGLFCWSWSSCFFGGMEILKMKCRCRSDASR